MAKEKKAKVAKIKKEKTLLITRYEVTAKAGEKFADDKNHSFGAILYRKLEAAKEPLSTKELLSELNYDQKKKMEKSFGVTLYGLKKDGYIKVTKERESVGKAASASA